MTAEAASSVHKTNARVAAILLAAGQARRMGSPKALLPWRGSSLLRHCARTALSSSCAEVYVILGSKADALENEIAELDVKTFHHEGWADGMGSTLSAAVAALSTDFDGVVVLLCDQPFATAELIDKLIDQGREHELAASAYADTLGPPAYFAASQFERLRALSGDRGAKALLLEHRESIASVPFPEGVFDIDEPADYERAIEELNRQSANREDS